MPNETTAAALDQAIKAWHFLVPPPGDRTPITPKTYYAVWLPVPAMLFIAYLARRPNTYLLRLLFMPIAITVSLRAAYAYVWTTPAYAPYNFMGGLFGLAAAVKALEFGIIPGGRRKIGEKILGQGVAADNEDKPRNGLSNGHGSFAPPTRPSVTAPLSRGFYDAVDLLCSLRGIGWEFGTGTGVYVPPHKFPTSPRDKWILSTVIHTLGGWLLLDFMESCMKLYPTLGHPGGGSIFLSNLATVPRYLLSTAIHLWSGSALVVGFDAMYYTLALPCVIFLDHDPAWWPPVYQNPWAATSLHDYWAKRWHQLLRQTFLTMGGYPLQYVVGGLAGETAGKAALAFGAFLGSGFYHCWAMYAMGSTDWSSVIFFGAQGVGVALERIWKRTTGRRVGGLWGGFWAWFWVIGLGQFAIDGWHQRGLGGGMIIPPFMSPTRLLLFPLILRIFNR